MFSLQGKSQILSKDETLQVIREGQVELVDGKPVKRKVTTFQLKANVQPMRGLELLLVPEGDRYKETYWLYTPELAQALQITDRIVRQGVNFIVQKVETWGAPPNGYQKALIVRIDAGPNTSTVKATGGTLE